MNLNTTKDWKDIVIETAEFLGWSVDIDDNGDNNFTFEFSQYSDAGQDFSFEVDGSSFDELVDNIYRYYESYDVSYETYLWLDETGHGRNGAPYDMMDVYKDMESCEYMVCRLHEVLSEVLYDVKRKTE